MCSNASLATEVAIYLYIISAEGLFPSSAPASNRERTVAGRLRAYGSAPLRQISTRLFHLYIEWFLFISSQEVDLLPTNRPVYFITVWRYF